MMMTMTLSLAGQVRYSACCSSYLKADRGQRCVHSDGIFLNGSEHLVAAFFLSHPKVSNSLMNSDNGSIDVAMDKENRGTFTLSCQVCQTSQ